METVVSIERFMAFERSFEMINIALVCDYRSVVDHLIKLVEAKGMGKVICKIYRGRHTYERLVRSGADLAIIQTGLIREDPVQLVQRVKRKIPMRFVGYTMKYNQYQTARLYQSKMESMILDNQEDDVKRGIIEKTYYGNRIFPDQFKLFKELNMGERSPFLPFTHREREILKLVASGLSNKEVACSLGVSLRTIEGHRARLGKKLGRSSTAYLTRFAIEQGYLETGMMEVENVSVL